MDVAASLRRALDMHRAGNLVGATEIYREIILVEPGNADAWNLLSAAFYAGGAHEQAVVMAQQAIAIQPDFFVPYVNLGNALQAVGRLADAVDAFQKAIALNPDGAEVYNNLASCLNALGRHREAAEFCAKALGLKSEFAEAHNNLGNALKGLGQPEQAAASYQKALALKPGDAATIYNLAGAKLAMGDLETAIDLYTSAVALDPDAPEKHYNLGNALQAAGRPEEAATCYRKALERRPGYLDALNNLGSAEQAAGSLDAAEACFRQATAIDPASADVHWNLALVLLQKGVYDEGWREYEWRWRNPAFTSPRRGFDRPPWDGGELGGRTILLHAEQGLGDTIQFIRYAPLVAARGGRVVAECRPPLKRLLGAVDGISEVVALGEDLPPFDCHLPLMSLPLAFATRIETIPARVPYLTVPADARAPRDLVEDRGLKVGFAWAGSPTRAGDRDRSCELEHFAPLFEIPGTTFYSLQVGRRTDELAALSPHRVIDLGSRFADFADTAAAIAALDLVIAVDTAVAHLAGALARPTWVALSFAPGYLWMRDRDDSPWYPTVRLFRQRARGDWWGVFAALGKALVERAGA